MVALLPRGGVLSVGVLDLLAIVLEMHVAAGVWRRALCVLAAVPTISSRRVCIVGGCEGRWVAW